MALLALLLESSLLKASLLETSWLEASLWPRALVSLTTMTIPRTTLWSEDLIALLVGSSISLPLSMSSIVLSLMMSSIALSWALLLDSRSMSVWPISVSKPARIVLLRLGTSVSGRLTNLGLLRSSLSLEFLFLSLKLECEINNSAKGFQV